MNIVSYSFKIGHPEEHFPFDVCKRYMYNINRNVFDLIKRSVGMNILFSKRLGILTIGSLLVLAGCQTSGSSAGESNKTTSSSAVEEDSSKTQ